MATATSNRAPAGEVEAETEHAERSQVFRWLVRTGFGARAVTYGVMGGLAIALALGAGTDGAAPDQEGALGLMARNPAGKVALAVLAVGLLAYALWKLSQGTLGRGPEGGGSPKPWDRIVNTAGGLVYVGFFVVALRALTGSAGDSSSQPRHTAAGVLGWPGGSVLVAVAGAALLAISAYQVYEAFRGRFANEVKTRSMGDRERRAFMILGRVGISARALAFALVGYFVLKTAIEYDPRNAVGVDGVLARLHHQVAGPELVALVAIGLLVFSVYSLLEGRYRRL